LKVMAFDEARFGLINWHRRRYCPKGFRPPRIVRRRYEWSWLYAAVEPKSGESFCSYMTHVDGECLEAFLRELGEAYPEDHLVVVMDNAPSHRSGAIALPENMSLLKLPSYSPELNPVERDGSWSSGEASPTGCSRASRLSSKPSPEYSNPTGQNPPS
jgi:hypothetical protein